VHFLDLLLPIICLLLIAILFSPRIRDNLFWRATVTPLASIIGSGFLIVAPLLGGLVGSMTPWAMLLIVALAYLIGGVIRFNIRHAEPLLVKGTATSGQRFVEYLSNLSLFVAYVISVTFYLRLMSAFILRGFETFTEITANALTTAVLLFIGITGWRRGLNALERLEEYSVTVKLAIIIALLFGLGYYDVSSDVWGAIPQPRERPFVEILRLLAGMLLVVQGFETSRYLGHQYSADMRVRTMRFAQWLSGLIYVGFAILIVPLISDLPPGHLDETAIIDLTRKVSLVLPLMLIIAATMSQFSAAVADTLGSGGLLTEMSRKKVSPGLGYLVVCVCAIALVWSTNIFEIVAYASRTFAFYYFAQTILAIQVIMSWPRGLRKWGRLAGLGLLSVVLFLVTLFAIPVS
jgi:hypothetical protein